MTTLFFILLILYFVPTSLCLWYVGGKKNIDRKLCYNPKKWASFLFGAVASLFLKKHIVEQLILRIYNDDICNKCWEDNKCSNCGCNRTKFLVPWESCDRVDGDDVVGWGKMILSEKEYKEFREKYPVKITVNIEYDKQGGI